MSIKEIHLMKAYFEDRAQELNDLAELDTMEMYRQLTSWGAELEEGPGPEKKPENFVHGCTSNVYIQGDLQEGAMIYRGSSEALVVRGYVAILVEGLSGHSPGQILEVAPGIIEEFARVTNIRATLTPSRANAFGNIFKLMQEKARLALGVSHGN